MISSDEARDRGLGLARGLVVVFMIWGVIALIVWAIVRVL
jgi:hypothetical protein